MSKYPAQIDNSLSLPAAVDNASTVSASIVNKLRAAILATQTELGIKPSGTFGTVRDRLDSLESAIVSAGSFVANGDLTGNNDSQTVTGLRGRPLVATAPTVGQFIGWDGFTWTPSNVISLNGDLGGTLATPSVIGLRGRSIAATAPSPGQVLGWNGSVWTPVVVNIGTNLSLTGTSTNGSVVNLLDATNNPFTLADGKSYAIKITALAERIDASGRAMWINDILMHCDTGIAIIDEQNITLELPNGETWIMDFNISGVNNILNATFTGALGHTINVEASVQWLELTGFNATTSVLLLTELGETLKTEDDQFIIVEA